MSNVSLVHPIRWPGSWHRKGEPRMARILSLNAASEIDLSDALERLEVVEATPIDKNVEASSSDDRHPARQQPGSPHDAGRRSRASRTLASAKDYHVGDSVSPAARLVGQRHVSRRGGATSSDRCHGGGSDLKTATTRWHDPIPATFRGPSGRRPQSWRQCARGVHVRPVFDPWEKHGVPGLSLRQFCRPAVRAVRWPTQSAVIGCDPHPRLAMAALVNFSGALDHRLSLKLMRHGNWTASPGLLGRARRGSLHQENARDYDPAAALWKNQQNSCSRCVRGSAEQSTKT